MKGLAKLYHWSYENLQQWWFDDGFGVKYVYLWFYLIFKVFIDIYEYAN